MRATLKDFQKEDVRDLIVFLRPAFSNRTECMKFLKRCYKRRRAWYSLWGACWYVEIADAMSSVRRERPALNIIFLMGMAEAIARVRNRGFRSEKLVRHFFYKISEEDKELLLGGIRRTFGRGYYHRLRFSSVIKILYEARNAAVHGEDYFSFQLATSKGYARNAGYSYSVITSGRLGKRRNKKRVERLEIKMTYMILRDIFIRTAIRNLEVRR
ncbi:MAG: hypothetical protein PHT12_00080 [Patescibacteria group bacterium]|nr:hypothetical protein [Patescibacteria group bacterium]